MRDFRALPSDYNPAKGWFASANQNNLPPDWPRDRIPAFSFSEPYRYQRIADVLSAQPRHRLADSVALQHDTLSTPARQLIALLPARARPGRAAGDRDAARLGRAARRRQRRRRPCSKSSGASSAAACSRRSCPSGRARWSTRSRRRCCSGCSPVPTARLGADPAAARDALFDAALAAAWTAARAQLGPDPAAWRWGSLHQVRIGHPLSRIPAIAAAFPPIEGEGSGGDNYTVMARWLRGARVLAGRRRRQLSPGDRRRRLGQFADAEFPRPVERSPLAALSRSILRPGSRARCSRCCSAAPPWTRMRVGRTVLRP